MPLSGRNTMRKRENERFLNSVKQNYTHFFLRKFLTLLPLHLALQHFITLTWHGEWRKISQREVLRKTFYSWGEEALSLQQRRDGLYTATSVRDVKEKWKTNLYERVHVGPSMIRICSLRDVKSLPLSLYPLCLHLQSLEFPLMANGQTCPSRLAAPKRAKMKRYVIPRADLKLEPLPSPLDDKLFFFFCVLNEMASRANLHKTC